MADRPEICRIRGDGMGRFTAAGILALLCGSLLLAAIPPVSAEMEIFSGSSQLSSMEIHDMTQDPTGNVYFGTDNGLSIYDGSWHITHREYRTGDGGLLSDYILALGFDSGGNLWIGFPNGLQRLEAGTYVTMKDQQVLKSLEIHGLLRRGREMWVAAGSSGIHRYIDGTWTWFSPGGPGGLGCGYVTSMATDPVTDTLFVACKEGIWSLNGTGRSLSFSPVVNPGLIPGPVRGIVGDPFGGVYLLYASTILHLTPPGQWSAAVTTTDLTPGIAINDLRVDARQTLWIATDNGIYAWKDGRVRLHLDSTSGIRNNAVQQLFLDSSGRLWFVTPENVGFYRVETSPGEEGGTIPVITYEVPGGTSPEVSLTAPVSQVTPGISVQGFPEETTGSQGGLPGFLDALLGFLRGLFGR
ncbi:MAG TPA: two-component regulator propeller domain-containing protein [Methanomicrobiales archaeon]|nr:two-component regulator propeller domain-containing protein [Methanomicrobiales archaeon]